MKGKTVCRVHNLLSSQIAGHLNKTPIKIRSDSCLHLVLLVTGSTNADFSLVPCIWIFLAANLLRFISS